MRDFAGAKAADHERYARLFHHMLDHGVWLPPSGYELWTLGTEHGPNEVEQVLEAAGLVRGLSGSDPCSRRNVAGAGRTEAVNPSKEGCPP